MKTFKGFIKEGIGSSTDDMAVDDGVNITDVANPEVVKRLSAYYIFKVIIPILLILSISWSVFWIDRSQIESKVNITMVALLSLIAYNLIMDEVIPKLDYLTFMDAFIFLSYLYTGAATILCIYSYYRYRKYKRKINLVDYYAKFVGPISYIVGIFICSIIYF